MRVGTGGVGEDGGGAIEAGVGGGALGMGASFFPLFLTTFGVAVTPDNFGSGIVVSMT